MLNADFSKCGSQARRQGFAKPLLVVLLVVGVGIFIALLRSKAPLPLPSPPPPLIPEVKTVPEPTSEQRLSAATLKMRQTLTSPVEIRFYALLEDTIGTSASRAFAGRVSHLLSEYEKAGRGMLRVSRVEARTSDAEKAARKDGITPRMKTPEGTNFLGLAFSCGEQKAVMASLAPDWEEALEFDLSRAILQVTSGLSGGQVVLNPTPESFAARDELQQAFPEIDTLPFEEGKKQLQAAGLEEYKEAVSAFRIQLNEAQQKLASAQKESPAAVEAAQKALKLLQSGQSRQLSAISQRMQARIAALEQIKAGRL